MFDYKTNYKSTKLLKTLSYSGYLLEQCVKTWRFAVLTKKKLAIFFFEKRECSTKRKFDKTFHQMTKAWYPKKNTVGTNSFEDTSLLNSDAH
jgi:hypothetical protein